MTECQAPRDSYELYALGVLDKAERDEIDSHLKRGCESCVEGVREATEVVAALAFAAPLREPRPELRLRLMEKIAPARPQHRWLLILSWSTVAVLVVASVIMVRENDSLEDRLAALQKAHKDLQGEVDTYRRAVAILSARSSQSIELAASAPEAPKLRAFWSPGVGLMLAGEHVPAPAANRTLQLWVVSKGGTAISAGIFRPGANGGVLYLSNVSVSIREAAALAITDEPAGGLDKPSTKPIWVGAVKT